MVNRRRRNNRRSNANSNQQTLIHPATLVSSNVSVSNITATQLGLILNRPGRPRWIELEYFSTVPRSFNLLVVAGNAEEVMRSKTILSGPIPKRMRLPCPTSTDFAEYSSGAANVLQFTHATNPGINFVVNAKWQYKATNPAVFF